MGVMKETLSTENENYIEGSLQSGRYRNRSELLNAAVSVLRTKERFIREANIGIEQLKRGESIVCESEQELHDLCEDVKRRGSERLAQTSADQTRK